MAQELSINDIRDLTKIQAALEREALDLRVERQEREKEVRARFNVALGEISNWYQQELAKLNDKVKALNEESKGLMPVHPRR